MECFAVRPFTSYVFLTLSSLDDDSVTSYCSFTHRLLAHLTQTILNVVTEDYFQHCYLF